MAASRSRGRGLGQQMLDTMEDVISLMEDTNDPTRKRELSRLRKRISQEAGALIEANLDAASREYREAAAGLKNASAVIKRAIRGLESVKKAIETTAGAVDLAARLVA